MHAFHLPVWIYFACVFCLVMAVVGVVLAVMDQAPRTWIRVGLFALWELVWLALTVLSGMVIWIFGSFPV